MIQSRLFLTELVAATRKLRKAGLYPQVVCLSGTLPLLVPCTQAQEEGPKHRELRHLARMLLAEAMIRKVAGSCRDLTLGLSLEAGAQELPQVSGA